MSKRRRTTSDPYSTGEFDAAFLKTQRSDPLYVATRAITLLAVYGILARGVMSGEFTAGLLLLPITVEWLTVMWLGVFLSRFVVDCPAFRKASDRPVLAIFWTVLIGAVISARLAWHGEGFGLDRVLPGWQWLAGRVVESGLIWALVLEVVGVVAATAPEIRNWKKTGGVFLWSSIMGLGLRLAAIILLGMAAFFVLVMAADVWTPFDTHTRFAWFVFGFLALVEFGALAMGVFMHRELKGGGGKR